MTSGGAVAGSSIAIAATFGRRFLGLMFRRGLPDGGGLLLMPCSSVHMCFMRFPLDIVYLDAGFRVVAVEQGLRPWRLGGLHKGVRMVLELPAGAAARCDLAVGSALTVREAAKAAALPQEEMRMSHG
jgi:uncharacterized protein